MFGLCGAVHPRTVRARSANSQPFVLCPFSDTDTCGVG
jgi:hypothetical protein